jgi:hypothetical protein
MYFDSYSNRVTVSEARITATITSSKGNPFALQQVQQHLALKLEIRTNGLKMV